VTKIVILSLALGAVAFGSQPGSDQNVRCHPQVIPPASNSPVLRPKPGSNLNGYKRSPIVTFDVDESGALHQVKIKRSSGSRTLDDLALSEVRRWRFQPLPGCGNLQSEALITIDFSSQ
jgi:TonB family protein